MRTRLAVTCLIVFIVAMANSTTSRIQSDKGIVASVDNKSRLYTIFDRETGWKFSGEFGESPSNVRSGNGVDVLGKYDEISFDWNEGIRLHGRIKVYHSTRTLVFSLTTLEAARNPQVSFPRFTNLPSSLRHFSYKDQVFAPPSFALEENCTPWILFDDSLNTAVISPANNFLASSMEGDGAQAIASGLRKEVSRLPRTFTQNSIMVFGHGINSTMRTWGLALTGLGGKSRPSNQVDAGLRYLGYWTDNGAAYYYNYDSTLGYGGTLLGLVRRYREEGIPIRYLQLDSWWYDKSYTGPDGRVGTIKNPRLPEGKWNRYGGMMEYKADSMLFPDGLAAFQKKLGLPLITHDRWLDPASPYHEKYKSLGLAPADPAWWDDIMSYLSSAGVVCYEQDWLNEIYWHSPELTNTVESGNTYLDNMHQAAGHKSLSLQYCMALPCFFLQSSRYNALTTIRVSDDRFGRDRWDSFLYTSQLAWAVGAWPWVDVFMSNETDNLLLSTLSAGMVGIGDAMGKENRPNLLRAVRQDGVIVKPDVPIVPADEMYSKDSRASGEPMVAWTFTDHGSLRTVYIFLYRREKNKTLGTFLPSTFGLQGKVVIYDTKTGSAERRDANMPVQFDLGNESSAYYVIADGGSSGIAFLGDEGKFVSNGRERISTLRESSVGLKVTILFAAGETSVRVFGFSPAKPIFRAVIGTVSDVSYHASDGRFEADVTPGSNVSRDLPGGDPVRRAVIVLSGR